MYKWSLSPTKMTWQELTIENENKQTNKETYNTFALANSFNPLSQQYETMSRNITCDTCISPLNILSLEPSGGSWTETLRVCLWWYGKPQNPYRGMLTCCDEECKNRHDNDGKNVLVSSLPSLEHIYTKEPREDKSNYQACHQEVTKRLSTPTSSSPLIWDTTAAYKSFVPLLHESDIPYTSYAFCSLATNFTHSAGKEQERKSMSNS